MRSLLLLLALGFVGSGCRLYALPANPQHLSWLGGLMTLSGSNQGGDKWSFEGDLIEFPDGTSLIVTGLPGGLPIVVTPDDHGHYRFQCVIPSGTIVVSAVFGAQVLTFRTFDVD